ncbi:hypothetical protein [Nitrospirillum pindoramense]|nr:hypothetical protein [Nitrospirillum amazonense]
MNLESLFRNILLHNPQGAIFSVATLIGAVGFLLVKERLRLEQVPTSGLRLAAETSVRTLFSMMAVFTASVLLSIVWEDTPQDAWMGVAMSGAIGLCFTVYVFTRSATQGGWRRGIELGARRLWLRWGFVALYSGYIAVIVKTLNVHDPVSIRLLQMPTMMLLSYLPVILKEPFLFLASAAR